MRLLRGILLSPFLCLLILAQPSRGAVDFEKDIQPIFKEHCIKCHGPEKQKSEFRVDQRALMLKGGDSGIAAVVPGRPVKASRGRCRELNYTAPERIGK